MAVQMTSNRPSIFHVYLGWLSKSNRPPSTWQTSLTILSRLTNSDGPHHTTLGTSFRKARSSRPFTCHLRGISVDFLGEIIAFAGVTYNQTAANRPQKVSPAEKRG